MTFERSEKRPGQAALGHIDGQMVPIYLGTTERPNRVPDPETIRLVSGMEKRPANLDVCLVRLPKRGVVLAGRDHCIQQPMVRSDFSTMLLAKRNLSAIREHLVKCSCGSETPNSNVVDFQADDREPRQAKKICKST